MTSADSVAIPRHLRHQARMHSGWLRVLLSFALVGASAWAQDAKKPAKGGKQSGDSHMKEELGVNQFTTPGIDMLLKALRDLRPVPYDKVSRQVPASAPSNRAQLAVSTGGVIADGFLAVIAERASDIEPVGRALLRNAKGLGVGDYVTRHTRSILEQAARKNWTEVEAELIGAQRDVEAGMMALKDEELAHLVALGGWWRGLEVTAAIIAESHTSERAALLVQPGVLDYFIDRMSTLNPRIKQTPLFTQLESNLRALRKLTVKDDRSPPTADEVRKIHELAKTTNEAVVKSPE
jgi:hypothetical protein